MVLATAANYANPEHPGLQDFGEIALHAARVAMVTSELTGIHPTRCPHGAMVGSPSSAPKAISNYANMWT